MRQTSRRLKIEAIKDGTKIIVIKSPTYYPGDMRILKQKNVKKLKHLVDVIVFPVNGIDRPHPHQIHER